MAAVARDRGGPKVDALYHVMQSFENKLGGGEGIEGLYGSLTQASMQKVIECLKHNSGLDGRSVFIDVGAGLGRPLLHAMVSVGVSSAWGVELDRVKCDKAASFCQNVVEHMKTQEVLTANADVPAVICSPIEKMTSLDPASHAYSFWEGVPPSGKKAFGELFAASRTLRAVAVVQRAMRGQDPAAVMRDLGFGPVVLIANFPVKMSGSGRSFTAYIFTKIAPAAANFIATAAAGGGGTAARALQAPAQRPQPQPHQPVARPCLEGHRGGGGDLEAVATPRKALPDALEVPPSQGPAGSPSQGRKSDDEAGPASPAKKVAVTRREEAEEASGEGPDADARVRRSGRAGRAKAAQQLLLTSLPEYSRRTKQAVASKPVSGKPGAKAAQPAFGTRSSQRLAAKVQAGAAEPAAPEVQARRLGESLIVLQDRRLIRVLQADGQSGLGRRVRVPPGHLPRDRLATSFLTSLACAGACDVLTW